MIILLPIVIFFIFGLLFKVYLSSKVKNRIKSIEKFVEEENELNFSRAKPIPENFFMNINVDFFKNEIFENIEKNLNKEDNTLSEIRKSILEKTTKPMVRLSENTSNTELKKNYGISNLDSIISAEGNYYDYIHGINNYSTLLIKHNYFEEAILSLEHCIYTLKCDVLPTFKNLIDLYKKNTDIPNIEKLKKYVIENDLYSDEFKNKIISYI
ncbi:MAG: hypothetical protein FWF57_07360 [Defluviitaleaceae bacterium]|nr:hypothetical protein [Defluviitaleaceae bacterium]